ncbi:hypothetical protein [Dyella sp. GSA-30]|uniref:hypothetical protein n=1 Tax=Dyella sp. GSA-30 TaxID=2994496 RepID=UPI0024913E96|nr:hypothetical protein [Dyella sp. GSA-30]BDU21004.1 hypothetical protein DYGSA30_24610 [Dyella sp. GSA-30]
MPLKARFVAAMVLLAAHLLPVAYGSEPAKGYIYDAADAGDNRALVIDVVTRNVEIQSKAKAHIDAPLGDLGGGYDDCGNEKFFCLTGLLEIVIPKAMPMKQWGYHGLFCKGVAQPRGDIYRIACRSSKYRGHPTYTYSRSRGVLSIDSSPIGGARGGFQLRGEYGLFSPGSNP